MRILIIAMTVKERLDQSMLKAKAIEIYNAVSKERGLRHEK